MVGKADVKSAVCCSSHLSHLPVHAPNQNALTSALEHNENDAECRKIPSYSRRTQSRSTPKSIGPTTNRAASARYYHAKNTRVLCIRFTRPTLKC